MFIGPNFFVAANLKIETNVVSKLTSRAILSCLYKPENDRRHGEPLNLFHGGKSIFFPADMYFGW
jgi:hypothetical protein